MGRWEPIVEGRLAEQVRAAVDEVVEALLVAPPHENEEIDPALLWAYVGGASEDPRVAARFDAAVDVLFARLATPSRPHLYNGLAGDAWVVGHISDDNDEVHGLVGDRVTEAIAHTPELDLIGGIAGLGVYLVEREHAAGMQAIVEAYAARAVRRDGGVTWFTPVELLPEWQREGAPAGQYNLGLAHGVPGPVAVLGAIAKRTGSAAARELAEGGLAWLRAMRDDTGDPRGAYIHCVLPDGDRTARRRTAWCYGDIGVAIACWRATHDLGGDVAEWRAVARAAAERPIELCGVLDPNLCHGAAGLAHLFNRCYQASRDPVFRDAAVRWIEQALAMRRPGEGLAGFTRHRPDLGTNETWPTFLDGTAGVVLALLAALGGEEPGWDRVLLCDLPVA